VKIAIIGTGHIGGNIGQVLGSKGHQIIFGVRDPQSPKTIAALDNVKNATVTSIAEAVASAQIVFLGVPWQARADALANAGDLTGKTLVDCTNRTSPGQPGLSSVEETAQLAKGAHVLKAFNSLAAETILNPHFGSAKATAFFVGDDANSKATLKQLGEEIGFYMADLGGLSNGYLIDAMFQAWIALAMGQKLGRRMAFHVVSSADDTK
jgi:predicted dinucleotide-binding enzyme